MARGQHQIEFLDNPNIDRTPAQIYAALDEFTDEIFAENTERFGNISVYVILPPLRYEGRFVKGLMFTESAELLVQRYPRIKEIFHLCAYSMWSSVAWSVQADALCMPFAHPDREAAYRARHPHRSHQPLVPLFDSDYTNEYVMAKQAVESRDIDVLCVSRLDRCKNLPMLAQALKVLRQKHPEHPMRVAFIPGRDVTANGVWLTSDERDVLRSMTQILGYLPDYLAFLPPMNQLQMSQYYSRARCYVLASLLEGKNRAALESMACDTPGVTFQAHCQYSRGPSLLYPENTGLMAPEFTAESLADTIYQVVRNYGDFKPRRSFLQHYGRKNFFNRALDVFPYYETALPDYRRGQHFTNLWLDLAVQDNYQVGLSQFIYDHNALISRPQGPQDIARSLGFYHARFELQGSISAAA